MKVDETLLLSRSEVARLLTIPDCIRAVEQMFRQLGEGKLPAPGIVGIKSPRGGLHIKAVLLPGERDYIVAKLNTNFPRNRTERELPSPSSTRSISRSNGPPLLLLSRRLDREAEFVGESAIVHDR